MPKKQSPKKEHIQKKRVSKVGGDNNNQQTQTNEMLNVETINARVENIQENLEKLSKTVNDVRKTVNDNKTNTNIDSASIAHWVLKLEKEVEKVMGTNPVAPSVNKTINGINGVVYNKIHAQQNKLKPQTSTINTQNKFKQLVPQANINKNLKNITNNYKSGYVPTLHTIPQVNSQQVKGIQGDSQNQESVISPNAVDKLPKTSTTQKSQNMNTILQDNSLDKNDFPLKLRELDNLDNLDNLDATATNRERVPINQGTEITNRVSKNVQENKEQAVGGKKKPRAKNPKKK